MILRGTNPLLNPLEGVGPCNGFARIKIVTSRATTGILIVSYKGLVLVSFKRAKRILNGNWAYILVLNYYRVCLISIYGTVFLALQNYRLFFNNYLLLR